MSNTDYKPRFSFEITYDQKERADRLLENYGMPNSTIQASQIYSVFASANGGGQIESIVPASVIKENLKTLSGDYLLK